MAPLVEARGLSKRFGEVVACADIDLSVMEGERHALLGENGAGKSTLVKMLDGLLAPSEGEILWQGKPVSIASPAEARSLGIGMVHQHFSLFDSLTAAENLALALPPERLSSIEERAADLSRRHGLRVDPRGRVASLGAGERQRLEILRCLMQAPRLLIMDEPTSVLTPQEARQLFGVVEGLSAEGCAVLYISHRLDEVRALCERATVLRRGRVVATCDPRQETPGSLAALMVGREVTEVRRTAGARKAGEVLLELDHLSLDVPKGQGTALSDISLTLRAGEILGIAGVAGEGQGSLMAVLSGERRAAPSMLRIMGREMGHRGPTARRLAGAAFVPEDRLGHSAVPEMGLSRNALLTLHGAERMARAGWLRIGAARAWAARVRDRFDVRAATGDPAAMSLSGGNLQKFAVGREILRQPRILVVSQPTWGVDAGAQAAIRQALLDLAASGAGVLVISQDLEELFSIADRLQIIHRGRLTPAEPVEALDAERVGLMMAGSIAERAA